jgi:hypothetical protein
VLKFIANNFYRLADRLATFTLRGDMLAKIHRMAEAGLTPAEIAWSLGHRPSAVMAVMRRQWPAGRQPKVTQWQG